MKSKLVQCYTICLITLIVLSPELVVLSIIWEQHLEWVQTEELVCNTSEVSADYAGLAPMQGDKNVSQKNLSLDTKFIQSSLTIKQKYKIVKILQLFFLLFPIFIGIFVILYDRYLIYRTAVLQQQVEMLERVWQHNIE